MEKLLFKVFFHPGMGIHTYDLSFWEAEPEDHCEFEASLGYIGLRGQCKANLNY